jgi:predicted ATPase
VRLLTLVGTGGSGKTRLALQVAWDLADQFNDGAVFVALAPLRDSALVLQAIGQACGLAQPSPATLAEHLRDKQLLLLLDNCEHLLAAAPQIAALLAGAPGLRVLATSRAALNLHGEHTLPVPPLPLPDLARLPPSAELGDVPSVALLLARTRALNPRFQLTAENAAAIANLQSAILDGLAALVDKSLVQAHAASDGEPSFVMLETIREYALARLRERGGYDDVAQAHASYFLTFAEQAKQHFHGPHVAEWAARIELAHDNLRAALRWFLEHRTGAEPALQLASALYSFWHLRGYCSEGLQSLERVLAKSAAIASPLRAEVLSQAGFLATALGHTDQAIALFEACLALCQTVDAPNTQTAALNGLGIIFDRAGHPRGIALLEEAAALARTLNNPVRLCAMLRALANALVTDGKQIERRIAVYEEALLLAREHQLVRNIGLILGVLARR